MATSLSCSGVVSIAGDGAPLCSGAWVLIPAPDPFDPSQLDPAELGVCFGVGFSLVAVFMLAGHGVRVVLNLIKNG